MIIGISGKIGSGKDTIGAIIQWLDSCGKMKDSEDFTKELLVTGQVFIDPSKYESSWKIKKFAGKLKQITALLLGCTVEQLEDRDFKEKELGEEWWYWFDKQIKEIVWAYLDSPEFITSNHQWELIKPTPRKILQLLGTEAGRQIIHPNIWVNALFADYEAGAFQFKNGTAHIKKMGNLPYTKNNLDKVGVKDYEQIDCSNWIITDVRFPNEAQAIKDRGGVVIRVERDTPKVAALFTRKDGSTEFITAKEHPSETALDNYKDFDYVIDNNGTIENLIDKVQEILSKEKIL